MRFALIGLLFIAFPLFAQETVSFQNDREGESYYADSWFTKRAVRRAVKSINGDDLLHSFQETLSEINENKICAFDITRDYKERLKKLNYKFKEIPGALHYLRSQNELDDVSLKILLNAHEITDKNPYPSRNQDYHESRRYLPHGKKLDEMLEVISTFESKYLSRNCYDDAYRLFYGELSKIENLHARELEALYLEAYDRGIIDLEIWKNLERARSFDVERNALGLKDYYKKRKSLRTQYPLRDPEERSRFSTREAHKNSRRQHLLENYTDLQIIMMGNVIKKLRSRLEADKIEILVYDREQIQEVIPLEPMERFRFAIKLLRKEMALLTINTYFAGRSPSYVDLMTAAYETGIIPAVELEDIAGLEDIWNPKKSFWEKAGIWVRTFSSVATVVIPPPYGFIPALALVVIEATTGQNDTNNNDDTSLF